MTFFNARVNGIVSMAACLLAGMLLTASFAQKPPLEETLLCACSEVIGPDDDAPPQDLMVPCDAVQALCGGNVGGEDPAGPSAPPQPQCSTPPPPEVSSLVYQVMASESSNGPSCQPPDDDDGDDPPACQTPLVPMRAGPPPAPQWQPPLVYTKRPISLGTGAVSEFVVDLYIDSPVFSVSHSRNYNSLRIKSGGGEIFDPNGTRWQSSSMGVYLTEASGGDINFYPTAFSKATFDLVSGNYVAPNEYDATLVKSGTGSAETFTLTETRTGLVYRFHGFDTAIAPAHQGRIKELTNKQYIAQGLNGAVYSYTNGFLTQITTAEPQSWSIEYNYNLSGNEFGRLASVEVKDGSSNIIKKAEYLYYGNVTSPSTDLGIYGDLVQAKVSHRTSDGSSWKARTTQYRYYKTSSTEGKKHQLKMVLESDAIEQINQAGNAAVDTPEELLAQADSYVVTGSNDIGDYASRSFIYYTSNFDTGTAQTTAWGSETFGSLYGGGNLNEYDTNAYGRVKSETINGQCSSCGGTGDSLKHTYYYMNLHGGSSSNPSEMTAITVEDTQDSTGTALYRTITGSNANLQKLRTVKIENPTAGTLKAWCRSTIIDSDFNITQKRTAAAHTLIDSNTEIANFLDPTTSTNDTDTLNTSDGLIHVYEYDGNNNQTGVRVKKGSSGAAAYVSAMDYGNGTTVPTYLATASYRYPQQTSTRANGIATTYAYTFWDVAMKQVQKRTMTQTAVPTAENGPNVASVTEDYYDRLGRLRWTKDALGYVNYMSYQPDTGGLAYQALDVNPSSMPASATGNDTKWVSALDDGDGDTSYGSGGIPTRTGAITTTRTMVATNEYDSQGRRTKSVEPGDRTHFTVYQPTRILQFPYWTGSAAGLPISASVTNNAGQLLQTYSVRADYTSISTASGAPTGFSSEPTQSDYVSWTRYGYEPFTNRRSTVDRYHDIPSSGTGTLSTNFDRSVSKYDNRGRLSYSVQTVSGTSTSSGKEQVSQRVYDFLDRVIETKTGVSSSSHDMTSAYTTLPTMTTISKTVYDDGLVGNSYVTKTQNHFGTGSNDYTGMKLKRTYRGHVRGQEPFSDGSTETANGPFPVVDVDWEGKSVTTSQYIAVPNWSTVLTGSGYSSYAGSVTTDRRTFSNNSYDVLGRVYKSRVYSVDQTNGALGNYFLTSYYYDLAGQQVALEKVHGTSTETAYDALGRAYQTRTTLVLEGTKYSSGAFNYRDPQPNPGFSSSNTSAMTGGNDKVVTIDHSVYDDIGNVTESHHFNNYHDQINGIDLSATSDYVRTSTYSWYDDQDRLTTTGEYGSGDTTAGAGTYKYAVVPSRPGTAPSSSSETVLVTKYSYESTTGRSSVTTSPKGLKSKTYYDDYGRSTFVAENYDNFDPTSLSTVSDGSDASKDRVTGTTYDGLSNTTTLVAYNGSSTATQTTRYLYDDTRNARWVTSTIYPDSTDTTSAGTNQVKVSYNVDGTQATRTDQRGVVIEYAYDGRRRPIIQKVSNLGSGGENVDGNVRSLSTVYDSLGRREKSTSHGNQVTTNTDTTNVKNQNTFIYTPLGQLVSDFQSHAGVVGGSTPSSQFAYDTTASSSIFTNNARQLSLTYPNARQLFYNYTESTHAGTQEFYDLTNMPRSLREATETGTALVSYRHTGDGTFVKALYDQPEVVLDLQQSSVNSYEGLDRFGRVKRQRWLDYTSGTVYRVEHAYIYDYDSNRMSAEDTIAANNSKNYDEKYAYDGLNRLTKTERGNLSGGSIASKTFEEDYLLDQLNNWAAYYRDLNGDGTDDLVQTRVHNDVNEITSIGASVGTNWADPTYDAAGNMVTCPKPNDPANSFTLRWDAWNRLVKVLDGANTIVEYEYDWMNRRILKKLYTGGTLTQTRHRYHAPGQDQVIEERTDSNTTAERQFTWGTRYIDDLVMRTRDTNADGTLDETLYALTDITYDVVALTDAAGAVVERFLYDPYGKSTVLDANFAVDADGVSDYDWEYRFTSRELDKETGLDYFRARYYSSGQGRFVNRDPIGYPDGMNAYSGYFAAFGLDPYGYKDIFNDELFGPEGPTGPIGRRVPPKYGGSQGTGIPRYAPTIPSARPIPTSMNGYDQGMLDYYRCIMYQIMMLSGIFNATGDLGSLECINGYDTTLSPNPVRPFPFPFGPEYKHLSDAMNYSYDNYTTTGYFGVNVGYPFFVSPSTSNVPWVPGFTIVPDTFYNSNPVNPVQTLIHEPMHDIVYRPHTLGLYGHGEFGLDAIARMEDTYGKVIDWATSVRVGGGGNLLDLAKANCGNALPVKPSPKPSPWIGGPVIIFSP